jgi:hypothetical protein
MTHVVAPLLALALLLAAAAPPAAAQSTEELRGLRQAIEALRESQQRMERELQEIKTLLRGRQAGAPEDEPKNVVLSIDGVPVKGERTARLALVDFTDYQ